MARCATKQREKGLIDKKNYGDEECPFVYLIVGYMKLRDLPFFFLLVQLPYTALE